MNDDTNEMGEADIIGLLNTYADALQSHHGTEAETGDGESPNAQRSLSAVPTTEPQSGDMVEHEQEMIDLDISPAEPKTNIRARVLAVAAALALVVGGAIVLVNNDSSQVDSTDVAADADNTDVAAPDELDVDETLDPEESGLVDDSVGDGADNTSIVSNSAFGFAGPNSVVVTDTGFARLIPGPDGYSLARTTDGVEWSNESVNGLPEAEGFVTGLIETDSGWVTLLQVFPEIDGAEDDLAQALLGTEPEQVLATSENLVDWTAIDIDVDGAEDGNTVFFNGIAVSGDTVAALGSVDLILGNEVDVLLELDLVTSEQLENFCSSEFDGEVFTAYSCGSEDVDLEEIIRLESGDPGFDEIAAINAAESFGEPIATTIVLAGPLDGPLETVEFPGNGFASGIAGTSDGFLVITSDFSSPTGGSQAFSSPDGITWTEQTSPAGNASFGQLAVVEDQVLVIGQELEGPIASVSAAVSNDLGITWTESTIPTELFGAFGLPVGGPGGFAVQLQGTAEPFADDFIPFPDLAEIIVEKDGFTLMVELETDAATLVGPDGVVIHEVAGALLDQGDVEGVARFEGPFDSTIVWLDPVTGEDLVAFTEDDMTAAFESQFGDFEEEAFEQPAMASEIWVSVDAVTWTLLDSEPALVDSAGSFSTAVAVSGDQLLIATETFGGAFGEPPAELLAFEDERRDPTEEELAALEAWSVGQGTETIWRVLPIN